MSNAIWQLTIELLKNPLILGIFILGILSGIFYKKIVGKKGELDVSLELNKLSKKDYLAMNNVVLVDKNNRTHQIDHLVLSKYGIFVIETKNFEGLIKGDTYQKSWMQILGQTHNQFYNPIHQNYGHIKVLEEVLNLPESYFISIISFSDKAKLDITGKGEVINLSKLLIKVKEYHFRRSK